MPQALDGRHPGRRGHDHRSLGRFFFALPDPGDDVAVPVSQIPSPLFGSRRSDGSYPFCIKSSWAPQPLLDEAQRSEFFNKCLLQLRSWFYDLPPRLRIDRPNQFPHVYVLHMTYHTGCILLARPFLRSWPTSAENTQEAAQKLCRNAARAILATAQKYQQQFSSFRRSPISATHAIVSAAVVFLGEYSVTGTGRSEIESCLQVLGELSTSWNCANRFCQNLRAALDRLSSTRTDLSPHLSRETIIPSE